MNSQKTNKKKVCIISTVHRLTDVRIFQKQARSLQKAGYKVNFIVQNNKEEIIDDIKIYHNDILELYMSSKRKVSNENEE
jgi:hypothetical protein